MNPGPLILARRLGAVLPPYLPPPPLPITAFRPPKITFPEPVMVPSGPYNVPPVGVPVSPGRVSPPPPPRVQLPGYAGGATCPPGQTRLPDGRCGTPTGGGPVMVPSGPFEVAPVGAPPPRPPTGRRGRAPISVFTPGLFAPSGGAIPFGLTGRGMLIGMGQTPSLQSIGRTLREGEEIQGNGGRIKKRIGFLWFFPSPGIMDKIEAAIGKRPDESIEARVTSCIPVPPIAPTLGAFFDPETRYYCDIDLPDEWRCVWSPWYCR